MSKEQELKMLQKKQHELVMRVLGRMWNHDECWAEEAGVVVGLLALVETMNTDVKPDVRAPEIITEMMQ
jgi:hypothetical protein